MPRILVTGATGFIGRACLKTLEKFDFEVHALHRNRPTLNMSHTCWHSCDVLNLSAVSNLIKRLKPTYLLHLAWIVDHGVYWTSDKNLDHELATIHLYKEFSSHGGKNALFIGTSAEYDRSYSLCEEYKTPLNPNTLYGKCKKQTLETLTQLKKQNVNLAEFSWVRLFNIYGPHEQEERLMPYIFLSYLQGKKPILQNPHSIRDYIHVQNLAEILVTLLIKHSVSVINAGSGIQLSIEEIAKIISLRYFEGESTTYQTTERLSPPDKFVPDLTLLKKLNQQLPLSFESSLDDTFEWFKCQNQSKLNK